MKKLIILILMLSVITIPVLATSSPAPHFYTGNIPINFSLMNSNYINGVTSSLYSSWDSSDVDSCIQSQGSFEIKCSDVTLTTESSCLSQGECSFDNDYLDTLNLHHSPCRSYCHSDEEALSGVTPHEIGATNGGTNTPLTDCNQLDISADRVEFFQSFWNGTPGPHNHILPTSRYMVYDMHSTSSNWHNVNKFQELTFSPFNSSDMCVWQGTHTLGSQGAFYFSETYLNFLFQYFSITMPSGLNYEETCDLLASSGDSMNIIDPSPLNLAINSNNLKFYDFERTTFTQYDGEWISTNTIETECHENPIVPSVNLQLRDFPEVIPENGIWPINTVLTMDASGSTPNNLTYFWLECDLGEELNSAGSIINNNCSPISLSNQADNSTVDYQLSGNKTINLLLGKDFTFSSGSGNIYIHTFDIIVEDFFPVYIETSLSGTTISPANPFTFLLSAFTFDGTELESFTFDPGQREIGNGKLIDVAGEFQCKESETVQCLIDYAFYEGIPRLGNPCGCPVDMNGAGTVYLGEKEGSKNDGTYDLKFDGSEFEYSFIFEYPTKTSCGPDRICQAKLQLTDVNGKTSEKIIELNLPEVQMCGSTYSNSVTGTSSNTQFVGYINDGEQACQCEFGYSPQLDNTLNTALSGSVKKCVQDEILVSNETTSTPPIIPNIPSVGSGSDIYDNNMDRDYSEYSQKVPLDTNEKGSSGTMLLVLLLSMIALIFGFEFYEKRKTGSYFNPFGKAKPKSKPSSSESPIQKFISDAKSAGEDPATIRQNLKNSGWPESEVNKYL